VGGSSAVDRLDALWLICSYPETKPTKVNFCKKNETEPQKGSGVERTAGRPREKGKRKWGWQGNETCPSKVQGHTKRRSGDLSLGQGGLDRRGSAGMKKEKKHRHLSILRVKINERQKRGAGGKAEKKMVDLKSG